MLLLYTLLPLPTGIKEVEWETDNNRKNKDTSVFLYKNTSKQNSASEVHFVPN